MQPISLVFVEGQFVEALSDLTALPPSVEFILNPSCVLRIPPHVQLTHPIYFKFLTPHDQPLLHRIEVGKEASAIFIEEHIADQYQAHLTTELFLEFNATLHYCKFQQASKDVKQMANFKVEQKASSVFHLFLADMSGATIENNIQVCLKEAFAECHLLGLYYLTQDQQTVANKMSVNHHAAKGQSSMIFKGILNQKSKAEFQGKVLVKQEATDTIAHQANHHLLLSDQAEARSLPQLEIYAEDIKCTHGATMGQLNEEALFYLRSRGFTKEAALKCLTDAFAADLLAQIKMPILRRYMEEKGLPC